ncbi:TPA: hypothetical protein F8R58_16030 [Legionella pneumophila]|nr:hypothetical protein [Legionella pneumophila]
MENCRKNRLSVSSSCCILGIQGNCQTGGWTDSKRTGKAAWSTIWNGWSKLNERIEGFLIAQRIFMDKM